MQFNFEHYWAYDEMTANLKAMAEAHPGLMSLTSIGQSPQGREVWAATLTNMATGEAATKPAYYIDGNHHAGEVTGSMASLYAIWRLLGDYANCAKTAKLLDTTTVYVIPRISPDGAEHYLQTPEMLRSSPKPYPFEDKAAGLHGSDLNGDGSVTMMRIPSPLGQWKPHPEDGRVMVRRAPDELDGQFYTVIPEGLVEDYDGLNLFEAIHKSGLDFNRNYPFGWFPEYRQPGAGRYPLSNPETKAVADFICDHGNIGGAATMHTTGGVIVYPPGTYSLKNTPKRDVTVFQAIGAMGTEETGYPIANVFDDFLQDTVNYSSGALDDYMYEYHGIPAYTVELWNLQERAGIENIWPRKPQSDAEQADHYVKIFKWIDENLGESAFTPWTEIDHPQLGKVEVGGFHFKFVYQNCPQGYLEAECEKTYRFCLRSAHTLPRLKVDSLTAAKAGDGVFHLKAIVSNYGYLPTFLTQAALNVKVALPVHAHLELPQGANLVSGKACQDIGHLEGVGFVGTKYSYQGITKTKDEHPISRQVEWVVTAKAGETVTVTFTQPKGGTASASVVL